MKKIVYIYIYLFNIPLIYIFFECVFQRQPYYLLTQQGGYWPTERVNYSYALVDNNVMNMYNKN